MQVKSADTLSRALEAMLSKEAVQWVPDFASALVTEQDCLSARVCITLAQLDCRKTTTEKYAFLEDCLPRGLFATIASSAA